MTTHKDAPPNSISAVETGPGQWMITNSYGSWDFTEDGISVCHLCGGEVTWPNGRLRVMYKVDHDGRSYVECKQYRRLAVCPNTGNEMDAPAFIY